MILFTSKRVAQMFNRTFEQHFLKDMGTELDKIQGAIHLLSSEERSQLSDGYHTFDELYEFRKVYNAALFNEWALQYIKNCEAIAQGIRLLHNPPPKYDVHKSWRHHDGELCFGGGWFVVVAMLPAGQITNHYKAEDWDLFKIPEAEKAKYEFDGHTAQDVLSRLKQL